MNTSDMVSKPLLHPHRFTQLTFKGPSHSQRLINWSVWIKLNQTTYLINQIKVIWLTKQKSSCN